MLLCAENSQIMEVPGETLREGILHLMASYYVYGVEYPKGCKSLLYVFQDIDVGMQYNIARAPKTLHHLALLPARISPSLRTTN